MAYPSKNYRKRDVKAAGKDDLNVSGTDFIENPENTGEELVEKTNQLHANVKQFL